MLIEQMKKRLQQERSGSSAFEWTLTLPFTIVLFAISMYIMLLLLSWANYGSVASIIAKDLNTRSYGLMYANSTISETIPTNVVVTGSSGGDLYTITKDKFTINGSTGGNSAEQAYRNALILAAADNADMLFFPYTQLESIDVSIRQISEDGSTSYSSIDMDGTLSNYLIKVDIQYYFAPFTIMGMSETTTLTISAVGYGIVT